MSALYTSTALMAESGATYRQVQYWTEKGWLRPVEIIGQDNAGSGNRRVYERSEVTIANALAYFSSLDNIAGELRNAVEGRTVHLIGLELRPTPVSGAAS